MSIWFKYDLARIFMFCISKTFSYQTMAYLGNKLTVIVNTLDGKTIPIEVHKCDTIWSIKYEIRKKNGFDENKQRLICENTHLYDGYRVKDYRLRDNDQLQVVVAQGLAWSQESQLQKAKEAMSAFRKIRAIKEKTIIKTMKFMKTPVLKAMKVQKKPSAAMSLCKPSKAMRISI